MFEEQCRSPAKLKRKEEGYPTGLHNDWCTLRTEKHIQFTLRLYDDLFITFSNLKRC